MLKFKSGLNETIFGSYEIFLKQKGAYVLAIGARTWLSEDSSMFEFVIGIIALSSASIFFAHAVESYLTQ